MSPANQTKAKAKTKPKAKAKAKTKAKAKPKAKAAAKKAGTTPKKKQDAYMATMKKQVDKLGAEIEKLEKKGQQATKDLKTEYRGQLKEARAAKKKLETRVKKLANASEDKWDKVREEVDHAWGAFTSSVNYFKSKFK